MGRPSTKAQFWNRRGVTRDELLAALPEALENSSSEPFIANAGMGWERWDLEISRRGVPWVVQVMTVTEYHERKDRLTRIKLTVVPTSFLMQVTLLLLGVLLLILCIPELQGAGLLIWTLLALFPLSQFARGWMMLRRVKRMVVETARRCGVEDDRGPEGEEH
jgi:uncharacterized membrane protein YqjE